MHTVLYVNLVYVCFYAQNTIQVLRVYESVGIYLLTTDQAHAGTPSGYLKKNEGEKKVYQQANWYEKLPSCWFYDFTSNYWSWSSQQGSDTVGDADKNVKDVAWSADLAPAALWMWREDCVLGTVGNYRASQSILIASPI